MSSQRDRRRGSGRLHLMAVAMLAAVAILAAACGSTSSGADASSDTTPADAAALTPVDGGTMVVGIGEETSGWNPALNQWVDAGSLVGSSVLEPLATVGADKGAKPWLAQSWIANEKFDSWLIKLRPGVTFQDGEPFNAAAVKQSIDFYTTAALTSLALEPLIKDVAVVDDLTVQVNLKQPWGAFPGVFMMGPFFMMAPAMLAASDQGQAHPIGTGPFTFDSWQSGNSFKAKRNPTYWQQGLPHLDSIEFRVIPDEASRAAALASGDVNMILTTSATSAAGADAADTVVKDWTTENAFVMTNTAPELSGKANPLNNVHARKALALATDRDAVARLIGEGVQIPTSPWSPESPWGMPDDQNGYVNHDVDQAKVEVAAYEHDTGASSLGLSLLGYPGVDDIEVFQLLQSQWKEAGINLSIDTLEQTAFITKIVTGDYQLAFTRNYGFDDPDTNFSFWSATTAKGVGTLSINFTQYTTPAMEADLTTGRESGYVDQRKQAYDDLTRQLNAGFTNLWLYRTPYSFIADRQVKGLDKPQEIGFGNYAPKTWLGDLWRATS